MKKRTRDRPASPSTPFPVFIAYADVSAARDALAWINRTLTRTNSLLRLQPMLWRFDQLGRPHWQEQALRDATNSRALIIAANPPALIDNSTTALERWLTLLASCHAGRPLTALAFFDHEEVWTLSLTRAETSAPAESAADVSPRSLALDAFAA